MLKDFVLHMKYN